MELGLEDAWVLSRMLENYEEDTADGLAAYAKYRRPRARRIAREVTATVKQHNALSPLGRLRRNINIAFSTRFIPEIAMQRIDWHYDYDCIRGFR
jgi:2-polyprenyl-6-methoxyphenol hydroxylase-like FAD-dependent oxidoreductase